MIAKRTVCFTLLILFLACAGPQNRIREPLSSPDLLKGHCGLIGSPRIEKISGHVWAAIGYDIANEILIQTPEGHVIIDPLMSPARGEAARRDLLAHVPGGPVKAVIFTHSHIDHIGGASLWMQDSPPVWAADSFTDHFFKQYAVFLPIEEIRGRRQMGEHVSRENLPCTGVGPRPDFEAVRGGAGVRLPTHTFSGINTLNIGGLEIKLLEAPGETHDQLIVWIPADRTVIAADNFYWSFPNLYTIRGTSPRPVSQWIRSIDLMRKLNPDHLVPGHTIPIHGKREIQTVLTNYRDAIQWVRDEVIRGANRGRDLDTLAAEIKLPPHLADLPYTREFYGQVDWSAKGIYTSHLGWFDGRPDRLYPMRAGEAARREIQLMGGAGKVLQAAEDAVQKKDFRWSIHLLSKLADSGLATGEMLNSVKNNLAVSYEGLASTLYNLNGRGYLLESAYELRHGLEKPAPVRIDENMAAGFPLESIFAGMASRLNPEKTMDVHESVYFVFPDEKKCYIVTVRRAIAEIVEGDPLPGTPDPVAVITTDALTFRQMTLKIIRPSSVLASGKVQIKGSTLRFLNWLRFFDRT